MILCIGIILQLPLCGLGLPAPVTDSCQLPGTNNLAASTQRE